MLLESMSTRIYCLPAKNSPTANVMNARSSNSVGGIRMESGSKKHLIYKSNHKGITIHVSAEELERYHSLTAEQKRLLRIIVKTLIYNPDLLSESSYLYKLLTSKAVSPYVCPLCLMPFSSYFSLKQHIRYTEHTTTCPVCKKEFQKTDALLDHVCKKHNICVS